jgi:hypothetical protein
MLYTLKLAGLAATAWAVGVFVSQALGSAGGSGNANLQNFPVELSSTQTSPQTTADSTGNWAGYVATGGEYSSVSGSWIVPSPAGSGEEAADAAWIGIGGERTHDLIQTGTQNTVMPGGEVQTNAFYEMLPDSELPIETMTVNPGDKMTAKISRGASGLWNISIKDLTTGTSFSKQVSYDSSGSSADWIEEDPSVSSNAQVPLDNFGTVSFTSASAVQNGKLVDLKKGGVHALNIANQAQEPLTSVSSVDTTGAGFQVSRTSASSIDTGSGYSETPWGHAHRRWGHGWGFTRPHHSIWW